MGMVVNLSIIPTAGRYKEKDQKFNASLRYKRLRVKKRIKH